MQLSKALQLFKEEVNVKYEPIIAYDWVNKVNSKKKLDERFFTATHAALYLSSVGILRNLKISRRYSWINFISVETFPNHNLAIFKFQTKANPVVELYCNDVNNFLMPVFNFLLHFLPVHHPNYSNIPQNFETKFLPLRSQSVSMYVSACYALNVPVDDDALSYIVSVVTSNGIFEVDKKKFTDESFKAIMLMLKYQKNLNYVNFLGNSLKDFWKIVSNTIKGSSEYSHLTVTNDYGKHDNFEVFCDVLKTTEIRRITFDTIEFTKKMVETLCDGLCDSSISSICFSSCAFNGTLMEGLFDNVNKNPDSLAKIKAFSVDNDETIIESNCVQKICNFVTFLNISDLELSYCNLDISKAFDVICTSKLPLLSIDLSGNYCSKDFKGGIAFPETLFTFDLTSMDWRGDSLSAFLTNTPFGSAVELILSKANISGESWSKFFATLPPPQQSPMIVKLDWSYNPIPSSFIRYILTMPCLTDLNIHHCHIQDSESIKLIAKMIQELPLKVLVLKRSFKQHSRYIMELKKALIKSKTLQVLDVSENAIGNDGISLLLEVSLQSETIDTISFDKSEPTDPTRLIELFNTLAGIPRIKKVSKPKRDIDSFSENRKAITDLKAAWMRLVESIKTKNDEDDDIDFDFSLPGSATPQSHGSGTPSKQASLLNATWDIEDEKIFPVSKEEWEKLDNLFSYSSITGIDVPSPSYQNDFNLFE